MKSTQNEIFRLKIWRFSTSPMWCLCVCVCMCVLRERWQSPQITHPIRLARDSLVRNEMCACIRILHGAGTLYSVTACRPADVEQLAQVCAHTHWKKQRLVIFFHLFSSTRQKTTTHCRTRARACVCVCAWSDIIYIYYELIGRENNSSNSSGDSTASNATTEITATTAMLKLCWTNDYDIWHITNWFINNFILSDVFFFIHFQRKTTT